MSCRIARVDSFAFCGLIMMDLFCYDIMLLLTATEWYLKISLPPYLLELDLERCIDTTHSNNNSRARIENGTLIVELRKKQGFRGLWGKVGQIVHRNCEPEIKIRREESIKEQLKREHEVG